MSPALGVYLSLFCCKFFEAWNSLPVVSYAQKLMSVYQFIADNNLATNRNACISSLCKIFALRQCLIGSCRFSNVIPGCAFPQVSAAENSSSLTILPHFASRRGKKLFIALTCFQFCHKLLLAFSKAGVLALPCNESLVFVLAGGNKWPLVSPRLAPMK